MKIREKLQKEIGSLNKSNWIFALILAFVVGFIIFNSVGINNRPVGAQMLIGSPITFRSCFNSSYSQRVN